MAYGGAASYDDWHSPVFFHAYRNLLSGSVHLQPRRQVHRHRREKGSKVFYAARVLVLCDGSGRSISRAAIPEGLERVLSVCFAGDRDMYFVSTGVNTAGRCGAAHQETNAAFIINCYLLKSYPDTFFVQGYRVPVIGASKIKYGQEHTDKRDCRRAVLFLRRNGRISIYGKFNKIGDPAVALIMPYGDTVYRIKVHGNNF